MKVECEDCNNQFITQRARLHTGKTLRYPYYNDTLGERVESSGHEDHLAKEAGMSIDERHNHW